jgi:DNA-binding NtrC family response regulator
VSSSDWSIQSFLAISTASELVQALKGEKPHLQLDAGIRLEPAVQALKDGFPLADIIQQAMDCLERYLILQVLESTAGNKAEAARILKIDYKTLYRKMYKYFGTFSDFVLPSSADGHFSPVSSWLRSVPTDPVVDYPPSVS